MLLRFVTAEVLNSGTLRRELQPENRLPKLVVEPIVNMVAISIMRKGVVPPPNVSTVVLGADNVISR